MGRYYWVYVWETAITDSDKTKCNNDKTKTINIKAKKLASKLKLEDRIQILDDNDAYISIKGHKEGFPDKIACRLINPSKTDID